jgi:hypothetical protein
VPRAQDIIGRHAQPRAVTSRAASSSASGGAGRDTSGHALYTGAWYYDGTATYGDGGRLTYNGEGYYDGRNSYYIPD